jgi:hypothetical protein
MKRRSSRHSWSVVVCAYTFERLEWTTECLSAVLAQLQDPQLIVVVDHNEGLRQELERRFPLVQVVENDGPPGLGAGRNTGLSRAEGDLVAFVDDDALPTPNWLTGLETAFDDPLVLAAGGHARPTWAGARPAWFPDEYLWVVGCSYRGMPLSGPVRNPIGCNMAFRRVPLLEAGGFNPLLGRLGDVPFGLEETELCVRLQRANPGGRIVMVRDAEVMHHVPLSRQSPHYFLQRCYQEGKGKALLSRLADGAALSSERSYALRTLPRALMRELGGLLRMRSPAVRLARSAAIAGGLASAAAGYAVGRTAEAVKPGHDRSAGKWRGGAAPPA